MTSSKKRGILILNLGSPDSPQVPDVKRYLDEFLMDPYVIDYPYLLRALVVKGIILRTRPPKSAEAYQSIWTDRGSPLIYHSEDLVEKLSKKISDPIELGMRYGNPSLKAAAQNLLEKAPDLDEIVALPLYPQYAMSTTKTCVEALKKVLKQLGYRGDLTVVDPFFDDPGYVKVLGDSIQKNLPKKWDHLLFSFHGVPERHLKKTDPTKSHCLTVENCCETSCKAAHAVCYRQHCLASMEAVARYLELEKGQYSASFQSRLGKDKWIEPYTDETLETLPGKGVKNLAIVCPAFVADCLETLEEIAIEGKEEFIKAGGESFTYIPCLNSGADWISYLSQRIS